jgi:hypothetical protein
MRIGELVEKTQVSGQTVHHDINAAILPRPHELGRAAILPPKAVATSNRSRRSKSSGRTTCFPSPRSRRSSRDSANRSRPIQLHSKYFTLLDRLLPDEIVGKPASRKATTLRPEWHGRNSS